MDKLPIDATHPGPSVARDPMSHPPDAAEFLDIQVHRLPRLRPFNTAGPSRAKPSWPNEPRSPGLRRPLGDLAPVQHHRRRNRSISTRSPLEIARGE
ncbi:MAG TPA: hypothetical protein VGQ24_16165 [Gemmatimonadales bacterium]|nr:hypothetical protein [Gemmatimonadales bacterium]